MGDFNVHKTIRYCSQLGKDRTLTFVFCFHPLRLWKTAHAWYIRKQPQTFFNAQIHQHILFILVDSCYEEVMIFLTWQSRVPSTHTINIHPAILRTCTQKLSMNGPLMTERSDAPPLRTGLLSVSTVQKGQTFQPWNLSLSILLCPLAVYLSSFLSQRLSVTAPPCPWLGYVSQW